MKKLLLAVTVVAMLCLGFIGYGLASSQTAEEKQRAEKIASLKEELAIREKFLSNRTQRLLKIELILARAIDEGQDSGELEHEDLKVFSVYMEKLFKTLEQRQVARHPNRVTGL